jgi:arabinogalactan oligomer/maltooligosaccharide transport system permease protein
MMAARFVSLVRLLALLFAVAWLPACSEPEREGLTLWHSYRGAEAEALHKVVGDYLKAHPGEQIELAAVPNEAYVNKIASAVPRGNGPDLFIYAHEMVGDWSRSGLILPNSLLGLKGDEAIFPAPTVQALTFEGKTFGLPLNTKTLALYYRTDRLAELGAAPPKTTAELVQLATRFTNRANSKFGLAYEAANFYFHSAWMFGFGGAIFDADGTLRLNRPENAAALDFAANLMNQSKVVPAEPNGALVLDLFQSGRALFAISGPWFASELREGTPFGVVPLPIISETGKPARPFMTVEAIFATTQLADRKRERAAEFMRYFAGPASSKVRALLGRQTVIHPEAFSDPEIAGNAFLKTFAAAAAQAEPMPNRPEMRTVWEPANAALDKVLRSTERATEALAAADLQLTRLLGPAPTAVSPRPYVALFFCVAVIGSGFFLRTLRRRRVWERAKQNPVAYLYIFPAAAALSLLVFLPFAVGSALSLYAHRYGQFTFVGFGNFLRILSAQDYAITDPYSFYFTLAVTVLWTVVNVFMHVALGLTLAMLLRDPWVKLKGVYRVLLIVPWAIPNYITALIWKGMFHVEFGAINRILELGGVERIDWFGQFATAFAANVTTNTWLGFPFMMVVSLGALQSIPRDLDEAAEVDGASRWQRFRHVTLPLLRPALVPAIILGSVWTFNMFNVIYLVSGGAPGGSTEILISEAYRWAFSRQYQYGYAAAYGVLIFLLLLLYTELTRNRSEER